MSRALTRCQSCRHQILDTFASLAGISIKPSQYSKTATPIQQQTPITRRAFHISSRRSDVEKSQQHQDEDSPNTTIPPAPPSQPAQNTAIPWYLQVETPTPPAPLESSPILALQEIPPLPSNPPQILLPILTHLSTTIGLDNLSLIDLRDIHPPPALGANLIMILGTARSYKHLNTSADRFCRYLRSKYKLSPYADGLLGRNELKLKLRRKARRMKLAQSVGNTVAMGEGSDDGITTGWVCVNVGSVENARIPEDEEEQQGAVTMSRDEQEELQVDEESYENPVDDGYIGFGSRSLAPRIVVQMFTEEKRLELDLEGLWDFRKEKRGAKSDRTDAEIREKARTSLGRNNGEGGGDFKPWVR